MSSRLWWIVPAAMLLAAGCGKDGSKVEKSDITGLWNATQVEYVSQATGESVDRIAQGCTCTLELGEDGHLVFTMSPPQGLPEVLRATWELTGDIGDLMRVTPEGATWYWAWDVNYSGSTLKLGGASAEYDFNGDGQGEPADWNLAFAR